MKKFLKILIPVFAVFETLCIILGFAISLDRDVPRHIRDIADNFFIFGMSVAVALLCFAVAAGAYNLAAALLNKDDPSPKGQKDE